MIFSFVENKVTRVLFSVDFISGISGFKGCSLCSLIILSQPSPNYSIYSTLARTFVIVGFLEYCSEIFHTSVLRVHLQLAKSLSNFKPTKNSTAIPKGSINVPSSRENSPSGRINSHYILIKYIQKQSSHTYMAIQIKPVQRAVHIHEVDCALSKKISHQWDLCIWSESIKGITFPGRTQWLHVSVF